MLLCSSIGFTAVSEAMTVVAIYPMHLIELDCHRSWALIVILLDVADTGKPPELVLSLGKARKSFR